MLDKLTRNSKRRMMCLFFCVAWKLSSYPYSIGWILKRRKEKKKIGATKPLRVLPPCNKQHRALGCVSCINVGKTAKEWCVSRDSESLHPPSSHFLCTPPTSYNFTWCPGELPPQPVSFYAIPGRSQGHQQHQKWPRGQGKFRLKGGHCIQWQGGHLWSGQKKCSHRVEEWNER